MKPKVSLISLGVNDLKIARKFYEALGFETLTEENTDSIVFFKLANENMLLGLYPKDKLAEDATIPNDGTGFSGFTLAHNVANPDRVDQTLQEAVNAGAKLVKPGQNVFWGGYSGYFSDPDGFLWEVAHNPFMDLT